MTVDAGDKTWRTDLDPVEIIGLQMRVRRLETALEPFATMAHPLPLPGARGARPTKRLYLCVDPVHLQRAWRVLSERPRT